jgi:hypothetical protein
MASSIALTAPCERDWMISKISSTAATGWPLKTARIASACAIDNDDRLAMVRLMILRPSRIDSRSKMAGGELRFGTISMYMDASIEYRHRFTSAWRAFTWVLLYSL